MECLMSYYDFGPNLSDFPIGKAWSTAKLWPKFRRFGHRSAGESSSEGSPKFVQSSAPFLYFLYGRVADVWPKFYKIQTKNVVGH